MKNNQIDTLRTGVQILGDANSSAAQREQAIAQIISSEATSGYWLSAVWRPLVMVIFTGLILAYFFGYTTPNLLAPMPDNSIIKQIFDLLQIGLTGYIPARTIEKVVQSINVSSLLKAYLSKAR
jgi:hypothetical protein